MNTNIYKKFIEVMQIKSVNCQKINVHYHLDNCCAIRTEFRPDVINLYNDDIEICSDDINIVINKPQEIYYDENENIYILKSGNIEIAVWF
jgi:hypothetical protein